MNNSIDNLLKGAPTYRKMLHGSSNQSNEYSYNEIPVLAHLIDKNKKDGCVDSCDHLLIGVQLNRISEKVILLDYWIEVTFKSTVPLPEITQMGKKDYVQRIFTTALFGNHLNTFTSTEEEID